MRWLIAAFTAIFLFFLLSGSRRIIISALLPYCALLMGYFYSRGLGAAAACFARIKRRYVILRWCYCWCCRQLPCGGAPHIVRGRFFHWQCSIYRVVPRCIGLLAGRVPGLRTTLILSSKSALQHKRAEYLVWQCCWLGGIFPADSRIAGWLRTQWPFAAT